MFGEQILDASIVQGEAEIQPDRTLDNQRRKAVAAIGEQSHGARLSYSALALTHFCDNAMWGYPSLLEAPKQEMLTVTPRH